MHRSEAKRSIFSLRKRLRKLKRFLTAEIWITDGDTRRRRYQSYPEYLAHQKSKLSQIRNLDRKRRILMDALRKRLSAVTWIKSGMSVLCLGARQGGECEVFIEMGTFAVGIDLNPGVENRHVMAGDFHQLQFADASIDCVFTNCLEHAFEVSTVIDEVRRVLKPGGLFIAEIVLGSRDERGRDPGEHDSVWWDHSESVIDKIKQGGFSEIQRQEFGKPWAGIQVVCSSLITMKASAARDLIAVDGFAPLGA